MRMKHCPFCGESKIAVGKTLIYGAGNYLPSVWCQNCGALVTAPKNDSEHAVELWNGRVLDVSREDLITLERLLKHDIYVRMRDYVKKYEENGNVCAHNDIIPFHLKPMTQACELMAKMEKLLIAVMGEKETEEDQ